MLFIRVRSSVTQTLRLCLFFCIRHDDCSESTCLFVLPVYCHSDGFLGDLNQILNAYVILGDIHGLCTVLASYQQAVCAWVSLPWSCHCSMSSDEPQRSLSVVPCEGESHAVGLFGLPFSVLYSPDFLLLLEALLKSELLCLW